jgi:hypothetical protein
MSLLAPTLQTFFTDRLIAQRHASGHTIAAYRDTWRLLLGYAAARTGSPPSRLDLADLDATLIAGFLDHLERDRGNSWLCQLEVAPRGRLGVAPVTV